MNDLVTLLWGLWLGALNHLWQCGLVMAALLIVDRVLRRAPAGRRADLWTLALIKLLLPAAAGAWLLARTSDATPVVVAMPAVTTVVSPRYASPDGPSTWLAAILVGLTVVWVAGVLWGLGRLAVDLVRQNSYGRGAHGVAGPRWLAAAKAAGVPRHLLLVAPAVRLPLVQGWWRPRILVPPHLLDTLTARELEALLRHEESHRRRRDPLRFLLGRVVGALLWFFPPVWWLLARLRECAEYAGDEAALATGLGRQEYTRALARAIRRGLDPAPPVAAAAGGGPSLMRRRLARLARKEQAHMTHGRLALLVAALVVVATALMPLNLVADDTPPPPPAKTAPTETVAPPAPPKGRPAEAEVPAPTAAPERLVPVAAPPQDPPPPPKPSTKAKSDKPAPPIKPKKGGDEALIVPPEIVKMAKPVYPEDVRNKGISGTVVVKLLISADGELVKIKVAKGPEELHKAAIKAAKSSVYRAGTRNGKAVEMWMACPYTFKVQ